MLTVLKMLLQFTAAPVLGFPFPYANTSLHPANYLQLWTAASGKLRCWDLWSTSLCCCLPLVKCSRICWNSLEPEFRVCLVACFLCFAHALFLQNMRICKWVFCLLVSFKQLICDGDSLLWTHLTSENLGPWEVSELSGYREGITMRNAMLEMP